MARTDLVHDGPFSGDRSSGDRSSGPATDLLEAELAAHPADRFLAAHRAALRATSAVLRVRAPRRVGRCNAWQLVAEVAPELAEWAAFFLATQPRCEAVEAGVRTIVGEREADDMLRDAQRFCAVVQAWCARRTADARGRTPEGRGGARSVS